MIIATSTEASGSEAQASTARAEVGVGVSRRRGEVGDRRLVSLDRLKPGSEKVLSPLESS